MTREQAVALFLSNWWEGLPARQIAEFQLFEPLLCMEFSAFQQAVETSLGRPVYTHEFAWVEDLQREFLGERAPPTLEEIIALIPEHKRLLVRGP